MHLHVTGEDVAMCQFSTPASQQPGQAQAIQHDPISAQDIQFVMRILARGEAQNLVSRRMAVRDLKHRSKHHRNITRVFDVEGDVETSLHLVECLPQGSRGAQPPAHEFLLLAKAVSGENAHPQRILENAILFEEYALQLLTEYTVHKGCATKGETHSPWLMFSGMEGKLPARSEFALSRLDRWALRQMRRLLGTISFRDKQGSLRSLNPSVGREQVCRTRHRPRKRRRKNASSSIICSSVRPEREEDEEDISGSYSSDYYTDTSDEELQKRGKFEEGSGEDQISGLQNLSEQIAVGDEIDVCP